MVDKEPVTQSKKYTQNKFQRDTKVLATFFAPGLIKFERPRIKISKLPMHSKPIRRS